VRAGAGSGSGVSGGVVAHDAIRRYFQERRIRPKKAAGVNLGQADVEMVAFELLQVVAANLCCFGRFADGDALFLARFFKPFADGLHEMIVS
jgi:hypothetical protein